MVIMLKNQLKEDVKIAMKSGDTVMRGTIAMLNAVIKNRELEKRGKLMKAGGDAATVESESQLNDEEVVEVISSEIKKRKEAMETFKVGGRPELAENEQKELAVLMRYMPEQMSEDQIREEVKKVIVETGVTIKEMGKAIGAVMAKLKGKADGTVVSRIVKEELSK